MDKSNRIFENDIGCQFSDHILCCDSYILKGQTIGEISNLGWKWCCKGPDDKPKLLCPQHVKKFESNYLRGD